MLRIWSWNVNGRYLWDRLAASEVDVALLQETPAPLGPWEGKVVPHPAVGWGTAGSSKLAPHRGRGRFRDDTT